MTSRRRALPVTGGEPGADRFGAALFRSAPSGAGGGGGTDPCADASGRVGRARWLRFTGPGQPPVEALTRPSAVMNTPSRRHRHAASRPFPGVASSAVSLACALAIGLLSPAVAGPSLDGPGAVIDGIDRAPRAKQVRIDAAQQEALRRDPLAQPLIARLAADAEMVRVASAGDIDRVRAMLAEGIGPDARDEAGQTALAGAVRGGHVAVARLLLSRGADPDRRGLHGLSPLMLATMRDPGELAALLLRHRADPDRRDATGHTPLSLAAHLDRPAVIRPLALAGADLQLAGRFGPPLVVCAEADAARTCTELLRAGADPEVRDANGRSPLLLAAINENAPIARALLAAGAEPGAVVLDWLER